MILSSRSPENCYVLAIGGFIAFAVATGRRPKN
jgi:hypothetical protein